MIRDKLLYNLEAANKGKTYNEVVDNSIDEAMAGYCSKIEVSLNADGSVTVQDNGRGIPVDIKPDSGKSALEIVHTVLHAGGKFGDGGYKVSGGLHGVGASVVNALSEKMVVEVSRAGYVWRQEYLRGEPTAPVEKMSPTTKTPTTSHAPKQLIGLPMHIIRRKTFQMPTTHSKDLSSYHQPTLSTYIPSPITT